MCVQLYVQLSLHLYHYKKNKAFVFLIQFLKVELRLMIWMPGDTRLHLLHFTQAFCQYVPGRVCQVSHCCSRGSVTKAMAASSLQNSSRTMIPLSRVRCSILWTRPRVNTGEVAHRQVDRQTFRYSPSAVVQSKQVSSGVQQSVCQIGNLLDPLHQVAHQLTVRQTGKETV